MLNQITLVGNVGQAPEIFNGDGWSVASFSLATNRKWKDKQSGETKTDTTWHRVKVNGGLVNVVQQYVKVGDTLSITGEMLNRKYEKNDGTTGYEYYVRVRELRMIKRAGQRDEQDNQTLPPPTNTPQGDDDLPF